MCSQEFWTNVTKMTKFQDTKEWQEDHEGRNRQFLTSFIFVTLYLFTLNNKVNRCLARYSPRATTTNRPTNRALNKPAWPGPNWPKMPILGQIWSFLGKKSFFLQENSKVLLPKITKPTEPPCSHWFLVGHWTKCEKNGNIWPKMTKNADLDQFWPFLGQKA